jgi:Fe-S cluster assembly ATP-binding protein
VIRPDAPVLLEIRALHADVEGQPILRGVDLTLRAGEIHAVMGRNGSGKSTLSKVLAGHPAYSVTGGTVLYRGDDLLALSPEERARTGLFLGFQYPIEIPGVSNLEFLRVATNARRLARGEEELDTFAFEDLVRERLQLVQMDPAFLDRSVNEGFSGGEKKRNEILQMALLEPAVAILDETDSGLDIDALRIVAGGVNHLAGPDNATLLITHYQRLLDVITPDFVHVMAAGRILRTGGKELALALEERGYDWVDEELGPLERAPAVWWPIPGARPCSPPWRQRSRSLPAMPTDRWRPCDGGAARVCSRDPCPPGAKKPGVSPTSAPWPRSPRPASPPPSTPPPTGPPLRPAPCGCGWMPESIPWPMCACRKASHPSRKPTSNRPSGRPWRPRAAGSTGPCASTK